MFFCVSLINIAKIRSYVHFEKNDQKGPKIDKNDPFLRHKFIQRSEKTTKTQKEVGKGLYTS